MYGKLKDNEIILRKHSELFEIEYAYKVIDFSIDSFYNVFMERNREWILTQN